MFSSSSFDAHGFQPSSKFVNYTSIVFSIVRPFARHTKPISGCAQQGIPSSKGNGGTVFIGFENLAGDKGELPCLCHLPDEKASAKCELFD